MKNLLSFFLPMRFKDSVQSFDEGMDAYQDGNYSTALNIWTPLAHHGCDAAQSALGLMSSLGVGLPQDHTAALHSLRQIHSVHFSHLSVAH